MLRYAIWVMLGLSATLCAAEPDYKPASPEPTPEETLILEYLNRMRADPVAEAERIAPENGKKSAYVFGNVDFDMFRSEMKQLKSAPPLVFNLQLLAAARNHSVYMIHNGLTHGEDPAKRGFTGGSFGERCKKAGYQGFSSAENCFRDARNAWASHVGFTVDFGAGPGGMQPGRGHRTNMMNGGHREIGCSAVPHDGRFSVTHDFGNRKVARMAGGVVFVDKNGNGFYDLDEGVGGVQITASDGSTSTTWASGAYQIDLKTADKVTLTANQGGLKFAREFAAGKENLKFDWVVPQAEHLARADELLKQVDAVKDPQSPAGFGALVALYMGTRGLALDPERQKRIAKLTATVGADLDAHQRAVLDALRDFDGAKFTKALYEHRRNYTSTVAGQWFKEAELIGSVKAAVQNWERQNAAAKAAPSAKREFVRQLEAGLKQVNEPVFRAELESAIARVRAV